MARRRRRRLAPAASATRPLATLEKELPENASAARVLWPPAATGAVNAGLQAGATAHDPRAV
jgi:hypothetical protein